MAKDREKGIYAAGTARYRWVMEKTSRRMFARLATVFAFAVLLAVSAAGARASSHFEALEIASAAGRYPFRVEVVRSVADQTRGLMFRQSLAADAGMLFLYPREGILIMWMKNTILSLDMIFFSSDGVITKIVERTVPLSEARISSEGQVRGVLEVNAGTAERLGVREGDRLIYAGFAQPPMPPR